MDAHFDGMQWELRTNACTFAFESEFTTVHFHAR